MCSRLVQPVQILICWIIKEKLIWNIPFLTLGKRSSDPNNPDFVPSVFPNHKSTTLPTLQDFSSNLVDDLFESIITMQTEDTSKFFIIQIPIHLKSSIIYFNVGYQMLKCCLEWFFFSRLRFIYFKGIIKKVYILRVFNFAIGKILHFAIFGFWNFSRVFNFFSF